MNDHSAGTNNRMSANFLVIGHHRASTDPRTRPHFDTACHDSTRSDVRAFVNCSIVIDTRLGVDDGISPNLGRRPDDRTRAD